MKRIIWVSIFFVAFFNIASSQMDRQIPPKSARVSQFFFKNPPEIVLPGFSAEEVTKLDNIDAQNGGLPKFARNIDTDIKLASSGRWVELPDGGRVWRVKLTSKGALALIPLFDTLYLPEGALLHVYTPGKEEIMGAFTHSNTPEPRAFCSGIIHGESCVIEYYEPALQKGKGILSINKIGYAYRWITPLAKNNESGSGSCEVNVACTEGDSWRDQIKSVVKIMVVFGSDTAGGEGFCTGALINNVRNDCTPYILSAEHCTDGGVSAAQYNQWQFIFNYQALTCNGTTGSDNDQINGCTKIADSEDNGGSRGSDFLLLKLNSTIPSGYNAFFSGWSNSDTIPHQGVCIHHPQADIKKISTYTTPAVSASLGGDTAKDTYWEIVWTPTQNGDGVTEPGSSGSPLYNEQKLIVGHLTSGNSCCVVGGCGNTTSGPTVQDFFGKVSFDWNLNGIANAVRLQPWLDPDNTGVRTLAGKYPPCGGLLHNDAGMQAISTPNGTICAPTFIPVVTLRNFGADILTFVTLSYIIDVDSGNIPISYQWIGTLIPGATTNVSLPSITLPGGNHTFTIYTSNPNHVTDSNSSNDTINTSFYISSENGKLVLNLSTDNQGSQITWQIIDTSNIVVASGGPYANFLGGQQFQIPVCLQPGCYTFTIFASDGGGLAEGKKGNFQLTGANGTPVYATLTTPYFGSEESHNLCLIEGIQEIENSYLSVAPNPSSGVFNIGFDNNQQKTVTVFDILGRRVFEKEFYDKNILISLSHFSKGIYILKTETVHGKNVRKLVVD